MDNLWLVAVDFSEASARAFAAAARIAVRNRASLGALHVVG
ncbi:MAG: universal stress protein [Phycisphaerales bacterium]